MTRRHLISFAYVSCPCGIFCPRTLDINTNVEARLKIMNGLSWHLVEDGYLGIGKHCPSTYLGSAQPTRDA